MTLATLLASQDPSPFDLVLEKDRKAVLRQCLKRLNKRQVILLTAIYTLEFSYGEVGAALRISKRRVQELHTRSLEILKEELDKKGIDRLNQVL